MQTQQNIRSLLSFYNLVQACNVSCMISTSERQYAKPKHAQPVITISSETASKVKLGEHVFMLAGKMIFAWMYAVCLTATNFCTTAS